MILFQSILEALESLATNKLRSGLTIIGIVIGVAAVISIVSIGRGAENTITGSIQGIGTNLLFVFRGGAEEVRNPKPITLGDANAIADPFQAPSIEGVAPVLNGSVSISFGGESTKTSLEGVTPIYSQVRNLTVSEGEFIREEHLLERASVVLLGSEVAKRLFGQSEGLVGATVHIEGQPFRVLGILESKGGSGFGNQDDRILVPLTTVQTRLLHRPTRDQVDMLAIQAVNANAVADASEEIAQILRARHRTKVGADDFTILSQQDFLDTARTITSVLTIFLGGIAAISLLVGGIGIMNIMLVSVTER
ncbi:MAG: ABC transporter permease, partial [Anaerolineae bacterium]|nr:ABC transporter permease [Anaerolineae bacterium]